MSHLNRRIKLQNTARLFHVEGDTVINRSGVEVRFPDEDRFVFLLLNKMDGEHLLSAAYEELPEEVRAHHAIDHAADVVDQLDPLCFFEDADVAERGRAHMSEYAHGRWNRNLDFFSAYCSVDQDKHAFQQAIANAKVILFGVGGVGTHALLDLVSLGFTNITAVDFDKVDLSNLNRQILYGEADVGRSKIEAAKEAIERYIDPARHNIRFSSAFIDGPDTAQPIVQGADIVIGCVDRPTNVVGWINEACVRERVPLVTGGVDTTRTTTYSIIPGVSGCVECWRKGYADSSSGNTSLLEQELARDVLTLPPRPAVVNLVSVHVGFLMSEVLKIVTGICPPSATNKLVQFDFRTMATSVPEEWSLDPTCSVCASLQLAQAAE